MTAYSITIDDIKALEAKGIRREIVNGQWLVLGHEGELHGAIKAMLIYLLMAFVVPQKLGRVYSGDTTYILNIKQEVKTMRLPDVSFVAAERIKTEDRGEYYEQAPDLAIEIISPSERAADIQAKVDDYLTYGTRQVWLVYPDTQQIVVYYPDGTATIHKNSQTLSGGDVLPGFELSIQQLFEAQNL